MPSNAFSLPMKVLGRVTALPPYVGTSFVICRIYDLQTNELLATLQNQVTLPRFRAQSSRIRWLMCSMSLPSKRMSRFPRLTLPS